MLYGCNIRLCVLDRSEAIKMFCRTFLKISWITEMDNPNVLQKIRYRSIDHKYQKEAVAIFWSDCEKIKSITCCDNWKESWKEKWMNTIRGDYWQSCVMARRGASTHTDAWCLRSQDVQKYSHSRPSASKLIMLIRGCWVLKYCLPGKGNNCLSWMSWRNN